MDYNAFFQSRLFKGGLIVLGVLIILLLAFKTGEFVGHRKADFSFQWADNYHRNFGGPRGGLFNDFEGKDYIGAHGTFGSIIKIDGANLIIKDQNGTEKTIIVTDKTTIREHMGTIAVTDLKVDDRVTIIGSPNNQGQIEAELIRVFN